MSIDEPHRTTKEYIGDGVYAEHDFSDLILTTENGVSVTNRIVLEPEVWRSLLAYVQHHMGGEHSR